VNTKEVTRLCRVIAAMCPAQRFDTETPATWALILAHIRYTDAQQAVVAIAARERFVSPSDIIAEVRRTRRGRLEAVADTLEPNVDPDEVATYIAEKRALLAAAADGTLDADAYRDGGYTLTGAEPRKAIGAAEEIARPDIVAEMGKVTKRPEAAE
jgi:hypothetical protein